MGFRFRKSFSLGRGARVTLGKSGASFGIGWRGIGANLNRRGATGRIGAGGVSWVSGAGWFVAIVTLAVMAALVLS